MAILIEKTSLLCSLHTSKVSMFLNYILRNIGTFSKSEVILPFKPIIINKTFIFFVLGIWCKNAWFINNWKYGTYVVLPFLNSKIFDFQCICRLVSISTAIVHICGGGGGGVGWGQCSVLFVGWQDAVQRSGEDKMAASWAELRYADGSGASVHVCTIDTPQSSLSLSLSPSSVIPSLSCLCRRPLRIHIQLHASCLDWKRKQFG